MDYRRAVDNELDKNFLDVFFKAKWEGAEKICSAIQACQCQSWDGYELNISLTLVTHNFLK